MVRRSNQSAYGEANCEHIFCWWPTKRQARPSALADDRDPGVRRL